MVSRSAVANMQVSLCTSLHMPAYAPPRPFSACHAVQRSALGSARFDWGPTMPLCHRAESMKRRQEVVRILQGSVIIPIRKPAERTAEMRMAGSLPVCAGLGPKEGAAAWAEPAQQGWSRLRLHPLRWQQQASDAPCPHIGRLLPALCWITDCHERTWHPKSAAV